MNAKIFPTILMILQFIAAIPYAIEDMPEDKTYRDVANAVRYSIGNIVKIISDIKTLQKLYMAIGGNVSRIVVTDEEVDAEIKLQDELKANDDSDEKKDVDDE